MNMPIFLSVTDMYTIITSSIGVKIKRKKKKQEYKTRSAAVGREVSFWITTS